MANGNLKEPAITNREYLSLWFRFRFLPFWYGILGMP